jgi:hypothetical protein
MASVGLAALTLMGALPHSAAAQRAGNWEELGCVEVGRRTEVDTIKVGRGEGRFKSVRIQVNKRDIRIQDLKVFYADGQPDVLAHNATVKVDTPTRPMELAGWARAIDRIELVASKTPGEDRGQAEVCISGLRASRDEIAAFRDRGSGSRETWAQLGCVEVGRRTDSDTVKVGRSEGRFKAIRLKVANHDINIRDLRVIYADGEPDLLAVNANVPADRTSRPLELKGWARAIDRIEMVSTKTDNQRGRAEVCMEGLQASREEISNFRPVVAAPPVRGDSGRGKWVELGCERAGFLPDRDVIKVGRKEGRFSAVRVWSDGNRIDIREMKIVYANGDSENLAAPNSIGDGERSRPLDLKGDRRSIEQIELMYSSKPSLKGQARVCVEGLE